MVYPVLAMVFLTFIVWIHMYVVRLSEMKTHGIGPEEMTAFNRNLPARIVTSGDNLRNLFEMPILFYVAATMIILTEVSDATFVYLCWAFVVLRYLHSFIHSTYNRVLHRFLVYAASSIVLWATWFRFGWILLTQEN